MQEMMRAKPQEEPKPEITLAYLSLYYVPEVKNTNFELEKQIVQNHVNIIAQKISARLTNELGGEIFIGEIEYAQGSIKVSCTVVAAWLFIAPIVQGYIIKQLPSTDSLFDETPVAEISEPEEYSRICRTIETVTKEVIEEYEKDTELKSKKTTVKTRKFEEVCSEWKLYR